MVNQERLRGERVLSPSSDLYPGVPPQFLYAVLEHERKQRLQGVIAVESQEPDDAHASSFPQQSQDMRHRAA